MRELHKWGDTVVNIDILDKIVKNAIKVIEDGKAQIYEIAENSRDEFLRLSSEVAALKIEASTLIQVVDELEKKEYKARFRLAEVSRNFKKFNEADIKDAYTSAQELQLNLVLLREKEKQTRNRRDNLEISLSKLDGITQKADHLVSHVGVVLQYLSENIDGLTPSIVEIQQKQLLGMRIIKAQEAERRRVAREIHDGPAQLLSNVVMRAEICQKFMELSQNDKVKDELISIKDFVRRGLQDVRQIIFDLSPMTLSDLGLIPAMKKHVENLVMRFNSKIRLKHLGAEYRYESSIELAIYRIFQEALNNAIKHSQAEQIEIVIDLQKEKAVISVKDNGIGFDKSELTISKYRESFGMVSMRERAELLDGEFTVSSEIGKGTEVSAWIPGKMRSS